MQIDLFAANDIVPAKPGIRHPGERRVAGYVEMTDVEIRINLGASAHTIADNDLPLVARYGRDVELIDQPFKGGTATIQPAELGPPAYCRAFVRSTQLADSTDSRYRRRLGRG